MVDEWRATDCVPQNVPELEENLQWRPLASDGSQGVSFKMRASTTSAHISSSQTLSLKCHHPALNTRKNWPNLHLEASVHAIRSPRGISDRQKCQCPTSPAGKTLEQPQRRSCPRPPYSPRARDRCPARRLRSCPPVFTPVPPAGRRGSPTGFVKSWRNLRARLSTRAFAQRWRCRVSLDFVGFGFG